MGWILGAGRNKKEWLQTKKNDGETAVNREFNLMAKLLSRANLISQNAAIGFQCTLIAMLDVGKCRCLLTVQDCKSGILTGQPELPWWLRPKFDDNWIPMEHRHWLTWALGWAGRPNSMTPAFRWMIDWATDWEPNYMTTVFLWMIDWVTDSEPN